MQTLLAELLDSIVSLPREITAVALSDPLSAVLVAVGSLIFLVSFALGGYLTLGALVDLIIPDSTGRAPPRTDR